VVAAQQQVGLVMREDLEVIKVSLLVTLLAVPLVALVFRAETEQASQQTHHKVEVVLVEAVLATPTSVAMAATVVHTAQEAVAAVAEPLQRPVVMAHPESA
jgi:hypothetical protein